MDEWSFDKVSLIRLETALSLIGRRSALIKIANKMVVTSMETGIPIEDMISAFQQAAILVDGNIPSEMRMQFVYELCEGTDSIRGIRGASHFDWVEAIIDRHRDEQP